MEVMLAKGKAGGMWKISALICNVHLDTTTRGAVEVGIDVEC